MEKQQKMKPNLVPKYNLFGNSAIEIGGVPTKGDFELDSFENGKFQIALLTFSQYFIDLFQFTGQTLSFHKMDEEGNYFHLDIKIKENVAKVDFKMKHKNVMFELAEKLTSYRISKMDKNILEVAGFHLTVLEPLRRWRVLFNGILR